MEEIIQKIMCIERNLYKNLENDINYYYDYCTLSYYLSTFFLDKNKKMSSIYKFKSRKALREMLIKVSNNHYNLGKMGTWNGIIGILYIMQSLNEYGDLDKKIKYLEKEVLLETIDFLKRDNYKIKNTDYDIISGLAGVGLYFLHSKELNEDLLKNISYKLVDMLSTIDILKIQDICESKTKIIANSRIDYSISHGILGIIYYLSKYYLLTDDKYILKIINASLQIYKNFLDDKEHNHITQFPSISDANIKNQTEFYYSNRTVWCYGSIGSFRALYLIASNINDIGLKEKVKEKIICFKNNKLSDFNLICPTFCHGLSGLYLILELFRKEENMQELQSTIIDLEQRIWSYYDPLLPYCFPKYDDDGKGRKESIYDDTSFVGGAVSIAICYLIKNSKDIENDFFTFSLALK